MFRQHDNNKSKAFYFLIIKSRASAAVYSGNNFCSVKWKKEENYLQLCGLFQCQMMI